MAKKNEQLAIRQRAKARFAERRAREDQLVDQAAGALLRQRDALAEAAVAEQDLAVAVQELRSVGITIDELAEILDVPASDLRPTKKTARRPQTETAASAEATDPVGDESTSGADQLRSVS